MALVPRTPASLFGNEISTSIPPPYPTGAPASLEGSVQYWFIRYQQAIQYQQNAGLQDKWARNWRWYRGWKQPMTEPLDWWRSNEVIPTCFRTVEKLLPKHVLGMFDQPDWFVVRGTEGTDERWELAITALLKEQLEEMNVFPTVYEALKYCIIMGHVWGKVTWKEEFQHRTIVQPLVVMDPDLGIPTGDSAMRKTTVTETVADRPHFEFLTLDALKVDPSGKNMWFIEEFDTTLEELEMMNKEIPGLYYNLDKLRNTNSAPGASVNATIDGYREPQSTEGIEQYTAKPPKKDTIGIWQCWGYVDPEHRPPGDNAEWRLVVFANRNTKIRDVPAPTPDGKPPYFGIKYIPIPGLVYGESILNYTGPLQDQQTRIANHRLDEVYLNIWGQYVYDTRANVQSNEMLFQPGGAIGVAGNPKDVFTVLERKPVLGEAYKEDEYREAVAERTAGIDDPMESVDRPTTGDTQLRFAQGNARFVALTMWLDQTFKKELLKRTYQFLQMRMPQERVLRIVGTDGIIYDVPLDISTIQIPVDIVINGGLLGLSKQARLDQTNELLSYAASPIFGPYMKADNILRRRLRELGWNNVDDYVKTPMDLYQEQMLGLGAGGGLGSGQPSGPPLGDGGAGGPATPQLGMGTEGMVGAGAGAPAGGM